MAENKRFYEVLSKHIKRACLLMGCEGAHLGGEAFEQGKFPPHPLDMWLRGLVNSSTRAIGGDSQWVRYSKRSEGYDQTIHGKKMSIKTVKLSRPYSCLTLTSYRLTKCKSEQELVAEILRRDASYEKVFLMARILADGNIEFIFYEIPVEYFELGAVIQSSAKSLKFALKNNGNTATIMYSASNQLSYSIKFADIEQYRTYMFTISVSTFDQYSERANQCLDNIVDEIDQIVATPPDANVNADGEKVVLSLFDGISCAQLALRAISANYTYYASEIDPHAIGITKHNFPNTVHVGDIREIKSSEFKNVYLLVGGSPCQNLSSRGNKKGLEGKESSLFYEYLRILREVAPTYFLLENVGSMSHANKNTITSLIREIRPEVRFIKINSQLFVPQKRNRGYWTNIPFNEADLPPEPTQAKVQDLLEEKVDDKYYYTEHNKSRSFVVNSYNANPASDLPIARTLKTMAYTGRAGVDNCYTTEYQPEGKTNLRRLTPREYERLQGIPDDYTAISNQTNRYKTIGNSFTVPVISWFLKYIFPFAAPIPEIKEISDIADPRESRTNLLAKCKARGLRGYSKMTKSDIIDLLNCQQSERGS